MSRAKSIEKILVFLTALTASIIILLFRNFNSFELKYLVIFAFALNLFFVLLILNVKRIKLFTALLIFCGVYYLILLAIFRNIRNLFPKPSMTDSEVIGFIHYNGYPLLFDFVLFFSLISGPVVFYFLLKFFFKHE